MDYSTSGFPVHHQLLELTQTQVIASWCHSTISSSVSLLSSCLQSFPASGSFQISPLFASGGQSIGVSASASVLPMNIQDRFPLGWSGWISLQSKGLSRVFSNTTVQKHQFFAAAAKSLQSCPTLCDPIDGGPLGSPILGILQARTLEWVAISFSNAWKGKVKVKSLSRVRLFATPWSAAYQSPPSMGFSRQEYWSGVPLPSPINSLALSFLSSPTLTSIHDYWKNHSLD